MIDDVGAPRVTVGRVETSGWSVPGNPSTGSLNPSRCSAKNASRRSLVSRHIRSGRMLVAASMPATGLPGRTGRNGMSMKLMWVEPAMRAV